MIHIERPPEPDEWREFFPGLLKDRARAFFSRPEESRRQERFDWGYAFNQESFALLRLGSRSGFNSKCAYCETNIERGHLARHRPPEFAMQLDGSVSPDHYWWLAFEWSNALLLCSECASAKSTYFPVRGSRALPEATGEALLAEQPLLIDPTLDFPEEHLSFELVDPHNITARTERGEVTIRYLNLNRPELLRQRAEVVAETLDQLVRWHNSSGLGWDVQGVRRVLATGQPHCGIRRQLIAWAANEWPVLHSYLRQSSEFRALAPLLAHYGLEQPKPTTRGERPFPTPTAEELPATPSPTNPPSPTSHRYLRRIRLENFKGIEALELEFSFATQ